jgi:hypothetical protein
MPVEKELRTAGDHWNEMVEPDFHDHQADLADLRRALHYAESLTHMADWVYQNHEAQVRGAFSFKDKNGNSQPVSDASTFANALEQQFPDFGRMRGIANAAKHFKLHTVRPVPDAPSHAANTRVRSTGFGEGGWGKGPWGGTPRVMLEATGGDLEFSDISTNVRKMWLGLNAQHNWW